MSCSDKFGKIEWMDNAYLVCRKKITAHFLYLNLHQDDSTA